MVTEATYRVSEGKLFVFDVIARDEGGKISKAVHKRAIVDAEISRLEQAAAKRVADLSKRL